MNQSMFHISDAQKLVKVNVILENDYQSSQRVIDDIPLNTDITDPNSYLNKKCLRASRTFFNKRAKTMNNNTNNPRALTNHSIINTNAANNTVTADVESMGEIRITERGGGATNSQLKDISDHKNLLFQ